VGSISGANLNPAVTLALAVSGKLSWFRAACYTLAQCTGSVLGALVVRSLAPELFRSAGGGANGVVANPNVGMWTVLGGEILGTAILVLCVCAAADVGREQKSKYQGALTPLMIGLAVSAAHLFLIPIDGCSLNPARSFGPAVAMLAFPDHWLFWVGPCIGAVLASLIYSNLFVGPTLSCGVGGGGGGAGEWDEGKGAGGSSSSGSSGSGKGGRGYEEGAGEGGATRVYGFSFSAPSVASTGGARASGSSARSIAGDRLSLEEDDDSLGSITAGSTAPTPLFGAVREGEGSSAGAAGATAAPPAAATIDRQLSVLQAQGKAGAVALARGSGVMGDGVAAAVGGGVLRRMSASPFNSVERQGVKDW
jgi:MIP family channel proteins